MAIGDAMEAVRNAGDLPVPLHLRNAPTRLMKHTGLWERIINMLTAMKKIFQRRNIYLMNYREKFFMSLAIMHEKKN